MTLYRTLLAVAAACALVLLLTSSDFSQDKATRGVRHAPSESAAAATSFVTSVNAPACAVRPSLFSPGDMALDFAAIASSEVSDKVTPSLFTAWPPHDFAGLYQRHLGARRAAPLRLLEIGLGCLMPEGPGRSIPIWRRFLPCARVSVIEFEGCLC